MTREWKVDGSNAQYWRSDNPLLAAWYRFNQNPKNNFLSYEEANGSYAYLSGLFTDSSSQKHHLLPYTRSIAVQSLVEPVASIVPWDPTGSGCQINYASNSSSEPDFLYADPSLTLQTRNAAGYAFDHGTLSNGQSMYSGITVIGWVKIPKIPTGQTNTTPRTIIGRSDNDSGSTTFISWRVLWTQPNDTDYTLSAGFNAEANLSFNGEDTIAQQAIKGLALRSTEVPFFPGDRTQPFWFIFQVMREADERNRNYTGLGSGLARLMVGTEASGLCATIERLFIGSNVNSDYIIPDEVGVPLSLFSDCRGFRSATGTGRHLPIGSIIDEVVIVNDGFMPIDRAVHYAMSGMTHVTTSDPTNTAFTPEYPQDTNLVAYWSFDNDDGANTAPATTTDPRLDLSLSGLGTTMSFVNGIDGGRAIRVTPVGTLAITSDGEDRLNSHDYPLIPAESGLPLLFPSGSNVDEGMTIIGWMRAVPTGNSLTGGGFGWVGGNGQHNNFMIECYGLTPTVNANSISSSTTISGAPGAITNSNVVVVSHENSTVASTRPGAGLGLAYPASSRSEPEYDVSDDGWHLWAGVYDVKDGLVYLVKDACRIIPMTQQISAASGFSSDGLGPHQGFFGFTPRSTASVEYDGFAVYNKILTLPEMSGFAISNIQGPPATPDLRTPLKSVVGYWPLNTTITLGTGSGFEDKSWYYHHLTSISGLFGFGSRLNTDLTSYSQALSVVTSGSMVNLPRTNHGQNLDAASANVFSTSGFSAGAWVYLPSGDLSTQGQGSSGLYGTHMIMGSWGGIDAESSWFMGIEGNKFALKFVENNLTLNEFTSTVEPTYNTAYFLGCNFFPSGSALRAQMVKVNAASSAEAEYLIDQTFTNADIVPNTVGASGFSLLNAPDKMWGFPQTTRIQHAFMNMGYLTYDRWPVMKTAAIGVQTLSAGTVSTTDPENISHWKFDENGSIVLDYGKENNRLSIYNLDSHGVGVAPAVHESGVVVRTSEYLDSGYDNPQSRRLDLGSGSQSWTMVGWVLMPATISNSDQHVIMNKGSGPSDSPTGIQVFTNATSFQPIAIAGAESVVGQNGDLAPGEWSHLAVTFDRDNNEFAMMVNGRYAGTSFVTLNEIPVNNSGLTLGGRGDQNFNALPGGSAFSGMIDDVMLFSRALTLPEISGLAANSYSFDSGATSISTSVGAWVSGINNNIVSGILGAYFQGLGEVSGIAGAYVSGINGVVDHIGGYINASVQLSGLLGSYMYGSLPMSGLFGHYIYGQGIVSGLLGHYLVGASQSVDEFDISVVFQIITSEDFDAQLGISKTEFYSFDSKVGVRRVTPPPQCAIVLPAIETVTSGIPYTLTVRGSGIALENKQVSRVRFTFADFKGSESGTLIDGPSYSGLYEAERVFDTPGWYTIKMEVIDSYGYRTSCARPFLLLPSGSTSGAYLASLPGVSISASVTTGSTVLRTYFTHALSGLDTTSGVLEYTDFADGQESLVNSTEMPSGTQFTDSLITHDYTMPGRYTPVWAVSGSWGIVSDSISAGIDYLG